MWEAMHFLEAYAVAVVDSLVSFWQVRNRGGACHTFSDMRFLASAWVRCFDTLLKLD
jgi:hypothetical protein